MNIKKLKENIDIGVSLATIIGSLVTPLGLIYTVHEYISQQRTWREEKTLDLYKKQLENPLLNNRINLDVFFDPGLRKKYLIAINATKPDNLTPLKNFTDDFSKDKSRDILILTNFYEGIVNCVNTDICDEATTKELFQQDIKDFVVLFGPFFCKLRQELNDPEIASKLEEFYGSKKKLCSKNNSHSVAKREELGFQK